jgi:hypothetical protein
MITNGQVQGQRKKAEAISILHLIDRIITSEEAGYRKTDPCIFQYAIEQLGVTFDTACMIGKSADSVKWALEAHMVAIVYSPTAQDSQRYLFGQQIPVIQHMNQLLGHFDISSQFTPRFVSTPGKLEIDGIGLEEPRHDIQISKEGVLPFLDKMRAVLFYMANNREQSVFHIQDMIRAITNGEVTYVTYNDALCRLGLIRASTP